MAKKLTFVALILFSVYVGLDRFGTAQLNNSVTTSTGSDRLLDQAFENQRGNFQVVGEGTVTRILPDDTKGNRHQRFIIRLGSGQTLLVAHNLDLAPRVEGLKAGESVAFNGEYEWNSEGGVIHWTHRDPDGRHVEGWIRYNGRTYQ